ncbi:phage tail protein [Acidobacteria bacterium ACD]|nr:MAG: phage tail protein [Acidobacteriota bacterium]MCE7958615.1 phage tail protein [Acidobacteria bacterium ACB2]MDL1949619.1 phage tail protein [Acidobacteria bacterium ACD]
MSSPYIGEIRLFAGNFAPLGWAFCDGSLIPISENDALFNLIGTTYGGDGQQTFALPDLRGRAPVHQGTGPGLGTYVIGQSGGVENVTLTQNQMPVHSHAQLATEISAQNPQPEGGIPAQSTTVQPYLTDAGQVALSPNAVSPAGGSQPHGNMQPFLCVSFIISLFGIFPSPT